MADNIGLQLLFSYSNKLTSNFEKRVFMNIETANRLLQYRKKSSLSQEALAEKIGVSRQAVSKWERAEASPDTDNLILLAEIYGVSLDELLKGEKKTEPEQETRQTAAQEPNQEEETTEGEDKSYHKVDKISFKNGIHIDSKDGDHVHISLKDGVHVADSSGARVSVDKNGVFVEENGAKRVYTDSQGNVYADDEVYSKHCCCNKKTKSKGKRIWDKFPFYAIALITFLLWGFSGVCLGWALSWVCFLTIPLYYSLGSAIFNRNPSHFAYPVLAVILYMFFGFFGVCGGWAMGWIVFLTIPLYYCICEAFKSDEKENENGCE